MSAMTAAAPRRRVPLQRLTLGGLGTLVALERAVAVDVPAGYLAPATAATGELGLILGLPLLVGNHTAWQVGGGLNEVALLCFIGVTIAAVRAGHRDRRTAPLTPRPERPLASALPAKGALV